MDSMKYEAILMVVETECTKRIWISCPICRKTGSLHIDKDETEAFVHQTMDSLVKLQVFAGEICEHDFTVTIDANFKAR